MATRRAVLVEVTVPVWFCSLDGEDCARCLWVGVMLGGSMGWCRAWCGAPLLTRWKLLHVWGCGG